MRSTTTISCTLAAAALAAGGLAACGSDDKSASSKAAPAKPTALTITTSDVAGKRFAMQAPSSIRGGLVQMTFKNASKVSHEAQLIRVDGQHSDAELLKVVNSDGPAKIPDWVHGEGGVSAVEAGASGTATSNLPAGRYVVIDTETGGDDNAPAPSTRGAIAQFTVTAGRAGTLPSSAGSITISDDGKDRYKFAAVGLKAGANPVLFKNASAKPEALHHVLAFPLVKGKTVADVRKFLSTQGRPSGPPPLDFDKGTGTEVLDNKRELVTTLTLQPGRYALVCFLNDRDETKPHFLEGLLEEVDVAA